MEYIEKIHNSVLTQVFTSSAEYEKHESECEMYARMYNSFVEALRGKCKYFIRGRFGSYAPYLQRVRIDFVDAKDWANNISDNSVYIDFSIDFKNGTIKAANFGHIYLTDEDNRKSHLCMCSVKDAHTNTGGKWMRESKYRSVDNAADKVVAFADVIFDKINRVTKGYPYKNMTVNIY